MLLGEWIMELHRKVARSCLMVKQFFKMQALQPFKTPGITNTNPQHHIPEEPNPQEHCNEKFKSYSLCSSFSYFESLYKINIISKT
jgi:hypothetical protein